VALADALVRVGQIPSLWWHTADSPTLVLGAGQPEPDAPREGIHVTRRRSGGTAVLATASVLGLDVLLPRGHHLALADVVEAYRWLGEVWAETIRRFGVEARMVSVAEARSATGPPSHLDAAVRLACFGTLSPYEVVVGERKLIGLAQVRRRNVLLQSGLHFAFDDAALARQLAPDNAGALAAELRRRATGLAEIGLTDVRIEDVGGVFAAVLNDRHAVVLQPGEWTSEELDHASSCT
jgi:lipoate-protein ligase A